METSLPRLILASESIYRKELLERLKLSFDTVAANIDEQGHKNNGSTPRDISRELSKLKGLNVQEKHPKGLILSGDQVLDFEGEIFDKPLSKDKAFHQLQRLQGKNHTLHTSYTLLAPNGHCLERTVSAHLQMRRLQDEEIERYIDHDDPLHCCGAYKLESLGLALFEKIECPDHSSITGLPLMLLAHDLRKLGFQIP